MVVRQTVYEDNVQYFTCTGTGSGIRNTVIWRSMHIALWTNDARLVFIVPDQFYEDTSQSNKRPMQLIHLLGTILSMMAGGERQVARDS